MKLHANAALSLKKRRLLCERVVVEGRTLGETAIWGCRSGPWKRPIGGLARDPEYLAALAQAPPG